VNVTVLKEDFTMQKLEKTLEKLKLIKSSESGNVHNKMIKHIGMLGNRTLFGLINNIWSMETTGFLKHERIHISYHYLK
jgi:hypothetical protein